LERGCVEDQPLHLRHSMPLLLAFSPVAVRDFGSFHPCLSVSIRG